MLSSTVVPEVVGVVADAWCPMALRPPAGANGVSRETGASLRSARDIAPLGEGCRADWMSGGLAAARDTRPWPRRVRLMSGHRGASRCSPPFRCTRLRSGASRTGRGVRVDVGVPHRGTSTWTAGHSRRAEGVGRRRTARVAVVTTSGWSSARPPRTGTGDAQRLFHVKRSAGDGAPGARRRNFPIAPVSVHRPVRRVSTVPYGIRCGVLL